MTTEQTAQQGPVEEWITEWLDAPLGRGTDIEAHHTALEVWSREQDARMLALEQQRDELARAVFDLTEAHGCRHRYPCNCKHCLDECDCLENGRKAWTKATGGQ